MTHDRFASRIDALNLVTLLVTLALAVPVFRVAATGMPWVGVLYGVVLVAVIWLYASTYYVVTGDELLVRSAWVRRAIPLRSIRRLRASRNPAAAAALSLRRIEVEFEGGSLLISPLDAQQFVRSVTARQPAVDTTGL